MKEQRRENKPSFRPPVWVTISVLLLFANLSSCIGEDPPDWEEIGVTSAATLSATTQQTSDDLIVYLDTSGSMAGYATKDGQNVFGRTLRAVRDIATSFKQPVRVSVRYVAAAVGDPDPDGALALQKASISPGIYNGGETDLAGAINSFNPKSQQPSPTESGTPKTPPAEEPELVASPPARFHILITDGVQSTRRQNTKLACLKGSDATCVREKIINLIKQGWGGYVIGLRSQFHGKIYSETGGRSFVYDTPEGNWKRYRPFYLYIFSPDSAALDEFVDVLRERVRPITQEESMRVLALTSPYTTKTTKPELTVPEESEDAVELSGEQEENPARLTLEVNRDIDEATPVPFEVAVKMPWSKQVQDSAPPEELVKLLRWEVEPIYPKGGVVQPGSSRRYPTVKLANDGRAPALDAQGRVAVQIMVGWPRSTAKPSWGVYRLQAKLDQAMEHDPLPWIRRWSTDLDRSTEYADRTLDLETVLISLWRNPVLEKQEVTTVYLRIGPQ